MDPNALGRTHATLQAAAERALCDPAYITELVVEPLTRLAVLAGLLTPEQPPLWPLNAPRIPLTTHGAATVADIARHKLGFDEVTPRYSLAANIPATINTLVFSLDLPGLVSACAVIGSTRFVVVSSDLGFQQLSVCARELGHVFSIASRLLLDGDAHITFPQSRGAGPTEYFAANFAIELLIPSMGLARALTRVRQLLKVRNGPLGDVEMLYLARIFGVTFSDLARKCERAHLLPMGGARAMMNFLDEKFGGPERRADEIGLPTRPRIEFPLAPSSFLAALKRRIAAAELSLEEAANALRVSERALTSALPQDPPPSESLWQ